MKIVVAIKQVPVRDASVRIDAAGAWIDEEGLSFEINEPDAYALEEGLLLKEQHGGEVVVLCAGPERCAQTIREALAKGADRAIHLTCGDLATIWRVRWAPNWPRPGRSATVVGCPWSGRWAVRARRFRRNCTWLSAYPARFSA
jgi:hypothetical protein